MPRHRKGWTPNQFFDNREIHRRRPLVMAAQPSSNGNITGLAQQTGPSDGDGQPMSGPPAPRRPRPVSTRGTSFVRDRNGTFQAVLALRAPRAVVPGVMESFLQRLGLDLQTIDTGAQVVRKQTPMGPLELVGTASLVLRLRNRTSSRRITVQVWRGEPGNRYDLYFDPSNSDLFLELEDNRNAQQPSNNAVRTAATASALPPRLRLEHPPTPPSFDGDNGHANGPGRQHGSNAQSPVSPNSTTGYQAHILDTGLTSASEPNLLDLLAFDQVFPQSTWGTMSSAVMTNTNTNTINPTPGDNHLATPFDYLTTAFIPNAHINHHQRAPDGFCPQCFDNALSGAAAN